MQSAAAVPGPARGEPEGRGGTVLPAAWLGSVAWPRFGVWVALVTVAYFAAMRLLQDRLGVTVPTIDITYPGWPLRPEPYEIPLYLLGYAVIPLLALGLQAVWPRRTWRFCLTLLAIAAAVRFLPWQRWSALVPPVSLGEYLQTRGLGHAFWLALTKRLYIVRISLLAGGLIWALTALRRWPDAVWVQRIVRWPHWGRIAPYGLAALAALVVDPNFPYIEGNSNYVLGPALDHLHGKPILYETSSIYGVLNTYLVAFVMWLLPSSVLRTAVLALVVTGLYLAFFVLLYRTVQRWLNSTFYALLATWAGLVVSFFLLADPYITPYDLNGQNVYRQGFFILPTLLIVWWDRTGRSRYRELALLVAAIGLLWNIETGLYLVVAMAASLGFAEAMRFDVSWPRRCAGAALLWLRQAGYVVAVFAVVSLVNAAVYGAFPDWRQQLFFLTAFEGGYGKLPMPAVGLYQVFVAAYILALWWSTRQVMTRQRVATVVPFLAVYGACGLLYYVGNSAWSYLNFTSLPFLLLLIAAIHAALQRPIPPRWACATLTGLLAFLLVMTAAKVPVVLAYRDYAAPSLFAVASSDQPLYADAQFLKRQLPETRLALFHHDDGKLLLWADKVNAWQYADETGRPVSSLVDDLQVVFRPQIRGLITQIEAQQFARVLITQRSDPRIADLEAYVQQRYAVERHLQTLTIYRIKAAPP